MNYQPPSKMMVEAINNIGKVCPMGLEFKPALCKAKHFIAKAKRKKGMLKDFNFCEKCELLMNKLAEEKNKQVPEKPASESTDKPQPEISVSEPTPAVSAVKKTQKPKNIEKCPTCNISYSKKRKIKGVCVNCYERNRRKSKRKEQLKKPDILELIELIDKRCAAVNKKLIEKIKEEYDLLTANELIKEKYDLLTAKRVLSGINKELENVN